MFTGEAQGGSAQDTAESTAIPIPSPYGGTARPTQSAQGSTTSPSPHTSQPQSQGHGLRIIDLDDFVPAFSYLSKGTPQAGMQHKCLYADEDQHAPAGSMGYVCKVYNSVGDIFALKRLNPSAPADRDLLAKALREEYRWHQELANVGGFPDLYGLGTVRETGEPAILMEWVEGEDLSDARRLLDLRPDGGVPATYVAELGVAVLEVLESMSHLKDHPVHRDISERNIIVNETHRNLSRQKREGSFDVYLVDLGSAIASEQRPASSGSNTSLQMGATPAFAAPEMLDLAYDEASRARRRSSAVDVYALCSVLYDLYAGRPPYRLENYGSLGPAEVKAGYDPDQLVAARPEDSGLVRVIMQGLERAQEDRPTVDQMMTGLLRWLEHHAPECDALKSQAPAAYHSPRNVNIPHITTYNSAGAVHPTVIQRPSGTTGPDGTAPMPPIGEGQGTPLPAQAGDEKYHVVYLIMGIFLAAAVLIMLLMNR